MSLRHALLAILDVRSMTGYELVSRFDRTIVSVWPAPHSQIYPELRRMESLGLIKAVELRRGPKAVKREYSLTDAGRAELIRWANDVTSPGPERNAQRLHADYLEYASFDQAALFFELHASFYEARSRLLREQMALLESRQDPDLQVRLSVKPEHKHKAIVAYRLHMYRALIRSCELEVRWAREGVKLVEELRD